MLAPALFYKPLFQNDTYWLINTGRYILQHGFPAFEPFTMHQDLHFIVQQWLSTIIFYKGYETAGNLGVHAIVVLCSLLVIFSSYRLALQMSNGKTLIAGYATAFIAVSLSFFMVPRPQAFSLFLFILEINLLELCIRSEKHSARVVSGLATISFFLINLHAAMWPFFFVLYLPYLIDSFRFRLGFLQGQGYSKIPLFAGFAIAFAAGLINPYGIRAMTYLFNSYGNSDINIYVIEMMSPNFKEPFGIFAFIVILSITLIYIVRTGTTRLRYALITIGTLYMSLTSIRSFSLFLVFSIIFICYYLKDLPTTSSITIRRRTIIVLIAGILFVPYRFSLLSKQQSLQTNFEPKGAVDYLKSSVDLHSLRLYNGYNTGGYLEFSGIKTFIDSRAEIFTKRINKKADIFTDYCNVMSGRLYYSDFISKYSFTHLLVDKGRLLDNCLANDKYYIKAYSDEYFVLYKRAFR
jgi:hypothetical protein